MGGVTLNSAKSAELGYAEITSNFAQVANGTLVYDITGLAITVTVGSRPIMLEVFIPTVTHSVASKQFQTRLYEGATMLSGSSMLAASTAAVGSGPGTTRVRLAPSVGSHTYKAAVTTSDVGTLTAIAATVAPAFIQAVEV